jgi:hypothetical protein
MRAELAAVAEDMAVAQRALELIDIGKSFPMLDAESSEASDSFMCQR